MTRRNPPRLSVVEVTRFRPRDAEYHAYVEMLNARAVSAAEMAGWSVDRVAAADVGTAALLERSDASEAIVIMGGEDIAPRFYRGAAGYPKEGPHLEAADEAQLALVRRALRRGTPLLGICRGLQIINVALGGTIVQDLGEGSAHRNDRVPIREIMSTHGVRLSAESRIARDLGTTRLTVQSAHHQAIDALGDGLVAVGRADDETIEVVEHAEAPITGVQFHPEDPGAPLGQLAALVALLAAGQPALV